MEQKLRFELVLGQSAKIWADYEQLLSWVFHVFRGKKNEAKKKLKYLEHLMLIF